ncbi:MAG: hypothetical protein JWN48_1899 [Myxococcaceae bacterium]|nr:hypothetical protein [Myxococcaceae bacterium]
MKATDNGASARIFREVQTGAAAGGLRGDEIASGKRGVALTKPSVGALRSTGRAPKGAAISKRLWLVST